MSSRKKNRLLIIVFVTFCGNSSLFAANSTIPPINHEPTSQCENALKKDDATKPVSLTALIGNMKIYIPFYKTTKKLPHELRMLLFEHINEYFNTVDQAAGLLKHLMRYENEEEEDIIAAAVTYLSKLEEPLFYKQDIVEIGDFTGYNSLLLSPYSEGADISDFNLKPGEFATFNDFIQSDFYSDPLRIGTWWVDPDTIAKILGITTSGPLRELYGLSSKRIIYWPTVHNMNSRPALVAGGAKDRLRVSTNITQENQRSSNEVFVKDKKGDWYPFVYVRKNDKWLPAKSILSEPIVKYCAFCHLYPNGKFHPKPSTLRNEVELVRVGYTKESAAIIMKEFNAWLKNNP